MDSVSRFAFVIGLVVATERRECGDRLHSKGEYLEGKGNELQLIVNSIKHYVHIFNGTAVISLLQPAPETYNLFDDIILISDGQIVYQGFREQVLEFFESMGFKCPERKGVADFLQEERSGAVLGTKRRALQFLTVKKFAEAFQSFHVGRKLRDELATQFDKAKSHPAALTTRKYGVKKAELVKACLSREFLLMNRSSFVYIFKFIQLTTMAMIVMTTFLRTDMHRNSVTDIHDRCKPSCFLEAKEAQ
ncbi:pleiotropic drug resistance protein 1-like [Quercus lobata]|uniref:pleiotropic drug resistance protein 1-like n=1 Tax=Quercus lobata TaxID=97700 RepID=UPI001244ED00|nr:pleiotropic drug resistance protein 1-like [Quercus lobata]